MSAKSQLITVVLCYLDLGILNPVSADELQLLRYTNLWTSSPARIADAAGVTFVPETGRLLISDSEISEYGQQVDPKTGEPIFRGANVFECSLDATQLFGSYMAFPTDPSHTEPVGIAWHPLDKHVYVVDDDEKRILRYRFDRDAKFGNPIETTSTSQGGAYTDPEGIAVDPVTGDLLVVSGTQEERVLRFHFDAESGHFWYLSEFPVAEHISDPEGIAVHPLDQHIFTISKQGVAEFSPSGEFIQFFPFDWWMNTDVELRLPGGATFAPSSDPNDLAEQLSLYVTCRGVDNGRFPEQNSLDGGLAEFTLVRKPLLEKVLNVPGQYATIKEAIQAAVEGDTVLVEPGLYVGGIDFGSKKVKLVSRQYLDHDKSHIGTTVLDGAGGDYVLKIGGPQPRTRREESSTTTKNRILIQGFTIQNANDGITSEGHFDISYCVVTETTDGIDYEAGGGTVRHCRFERNRDDAIDLDNDTSAIIEHCQLVDNGDDGIEIRLQPYDARETLEIIVRNNYIAGNNEDGIQLIGYDVKTNRSFLFQDNLIVRNAMSGIGFMSGQNTREDYESAPLPEQVIVSNCTFAENEYHITGGGNGLLVNNLFVDARAGGVKKQAGNSLVIGNLFWNASIEDVAESLLSDNRNLPVAWVGDTFIPAAGTAAIDSGRSSVTWGGKSWQVVRPENTRGLAPDLGALER